MFQRLITYLKEVRLEMRKVNWPTRSNVVRFTVTVIAVSLGVAILLGTLDLIFTRILALIV